MLTQKEAAHQLGVTVQTVRRWVRIGILRQYTTRAGAIRGFRRVRYDIGDIERLLSYTEQVRTRHLGRLAN